MTPKHHHIAHGEEGNHLFGLFYYTHIYVNLCVCFGHFGLHFMGIAQNGIINFFPLWKEILRGENITRLIPCSNPDDLKPEKNFSSPIVCFL